MPLQPTCFRTCRRRRSKPAFRRCGTSRTGSKPWRIQPATSPPNNRARRARFPGRPSSDFLREPDEESAASAELRREHADAAAVADLIDLVEEVDHVEAYRERLGA